MSPALPPARRRAPRRGSLRSRQDLPRQRVARRDPRPL